MAKEIVSFEHFDPEFELGQMDATGQPIRPRKKPGRKPNPPSPAQRKAQNRAAQRAFRERKRYEMREAQLTAKKCIQARNQALCQVKVLKRRVEELEYETNYLKGYTLTLRLACEANHVVVPKFWDAGTTDEIGVEEMTFSRTKGIPQQLEFFLDKQMNVINFDQLQQNIGTKDIENPPNLVISPSTSYSYLNTGSSLSSVCSDIDSNSTRHDSDADSQKSTKQQPQEDVTAEEEAMEEDVVMEEDLVPYLPSKVDNLYLQNLLEDLHHQENSVCTTSNAGIATPNEFPREHNGLSLSPIFPSVYFDEFNEEMDEKIIDSKTGIIRTISEWPTSTTVNEEDLKNKEKKIFPPMTVGEAMKIIKSIKHLDDDAMVIFTPTELQRTVRHDPRIDAIPGPTYRDLLILYQDYYNANELFNFLADNTVFLGGELGNLDSWFVPPEFFRKYWFIIPSHQRQRIDNAVEVMAYVNKKMIELLSKRKAMYIEREQYQEYFPTPTKEEQQEIDNAFLQKDDMQILSDMLLEAQQQEDIKKEENQDDAKEEDIEDEEIMKDTNTIQPLKLIPSNLPLSQFQQTIF